MACTSLFKKGEIPKDWLLVQAVATVDEDVGTSHEAGRVGAEEDAKAVELIDFTQAVLGGEATPDLLLGVEGGNTVEGSVHVARGDGVDTDLVLGPLSGNGLAELDDTSLGGVVAALLLGVVDNGAGHGGDEDQAAGLASGHHGAADGLGHEESASEVDVDETAEHGGVVGLGLDVGVGNTSGVDEGVGAAVDVDDGVDGGVDGSAVTDVNLEEGDGNARLLVQLSSGGVAELLVGVKDDNVLRAGLGTGAGHVVTQTTGAAGDNDGLAVDGHVLHGVGERLVGLLAQGLDGIVLGRRSRAVVGDLGGALGDVNGVTVGVVAGALVDGDGDLLLADDALLVGRVGDAVDAGGGEAAGGVAGRGRDARGGRSGAGEPQEVASSERHDAFGVCVAGEGVSGGAVEDEVGRGERGYRLCETRRGVRGRINQSEMVKEQIQKKRMGLEDAKYIFASSRGFAPRAASFGGA